MDTSIVLNDGARGKFGILAFSAGHGGNNPNMHSLPRVGKMFTGAGIGGRMDMPGKCELLDYELRIVRYRAPAHACNVCSMKRDCTTSDRGREIERQIGAWLNSEVRRFHRGASHVLRLLAALILGIAALRPAQQNDRLVLLSALAVMAAATMRPSRWQRRRTDVPSLESSQLGITAHQRYPQS